MLSLAWNCGRHGGLMVSAQNSELKGLGSSPGRVIVLCSWEGTLLSQCLSPPRSINGYRQTVREA